MKLFKLCLKSALILVPSLMIYSTSSFAAVGAGLWQNDFSPNLQPIDCTSNGDVYGPDANGFCHIDDGGSVELGVNFEVSHPVLITGVRIYRVDEDDVVGLLRSSDGTIVEQGLFDVYLGDHGWQDLAFDSPVVASPGQTYLASYLTPNAQYAFEWDAFTSTAITNGPITALQAIDGNQNGVYCYAADSQPCTYPVNHFRDTNYWVTPLWAYQFDGFYKPVDMDALNKAKAGRAIPVKFSLGGDVGLEIFKQGYPKVKKIACPNDGTPVEDISEDAAYAGGSNLSYDPDSDQYTFVWKTSSNWAGQCYEFDLGLIDDTDHHFDVQFK